MKCHEAESLLYVRDLLSLEESEQLTAHISGCASCRALLENYQPVEDMIRKSAPAAPVPLDSSRLTVNVMARVFEQTPAAMQSERLIFRLFRYGFTAMCFCILLIFYAEWQKVPAEIPGNDIHSGIRREATLVSPSVRLLREKQRDGFSLYEKFRNNAQHSE